MFLSGMYRGIGAFCRGLLQKEGKESDTVSGFPLV